MTDQAPRPPEAPRYVSEEQVRARALAEVLRDQETRSVAAREADERRERSTRVRRRVMIATWVVAGYIWVAAPSWSRVEQPPFPSVEGEATALRFNVFLQSQAIEAYRMQTGRLPFVLQDAGPPFRGMEYRRFDSQTYELQGRSHRVILRYHSEQPALDFVGDAARALDGGPSIGASGQSGVGAAGGTP